VTLAYAPETATSAQFRSHPVALTVEILPIQGGDGNLRGRSVHDPGKRRETSGKRHESAIGIQENAMCRNIKTLFNFEPPATGDEIQASALQFVRKLSGFNKPSQANAEAFERAVAEVSASARRLLVSLHTHAPARDRETEAERARERSRQRFG
jgi:hypothetical protein